MVTPKNLHDRARAEGESALRNAWRAWFDDPGGFRFEEEETVIDEAGSVAVDSHLALSRAGFQGKRGEPTVWAC